MKPWNDLLLLVVEGADGSGKKTQTDLLCQRLAASGRPLIRLDFPTYGRDPVADCIRHLLTKRKDEWIQRPWESKAMLYASNRLREFSALEEVLVEGTIVVCNRYVPSNQAHMAAYHAHEKDWLGVFHWIELLEYNSLRLPRPDIVLLLTMPRSRRSALLSERERGALDAHEADAAYQDRVETCFEALARDKPNIWRVIPAEVSGRLQRPGEIHERLWHVVESHHTWQRFREAFPPLP